MIFIDKGISRYILFLHYLPQRLITYQFCPEAARCVASPAGIFLFGRTFDFQSAVHR